MTTITKELHGHTITIDDKYMRFLVAGPIIDGWFDRYREADEAITSATQKHEAQTRKRIALVVLDGNGNKQTITGVHAGLGKVLGLPDTRGWDEYSYYPNVPWIIESLKRIHQLQQELSAAQQTVNRFGMNRSGRDLVGATHAEKVDALVALVEANTKAAIEQGG